MYIFFVLAGVGTVGSTFTGLVRGRVRVRVGLGLGLGLGLAPNP